MNKTSRDLTLEFHSLMSNRMDKTEHIGMKTQASTWIIAITIFYIATHRMPHIGTMNTYLIFSSCFKSLLH